MNLHDSYKTLLRRGMPEHPHLHWEDDFKEGFYDGESSHPVADANARAIITMHALGWFTGENFGHTKEGEAYGGKFGSIEYRIDLDDKRKDKPYKRWAVSAMFDTPDDFKPKFGDTLFDAIVAATTPLDVTPRKPGEVRTYTQRA